MRSGKIARTRYSACGLISSSGARKRSWGYQGTDPRRHRLDADGGANRGEAAEILARPEYVGADADVIAKSMTGTFEDEKGDRRPAPDFNVFFCYSATYPYYSGAVWYPAQIRRWGQITEAKPDAGTWKPQPRSTVPTSIFRPHGCW